MLPSLLPPAQLTAQHYVDLLSRQTFSVQLGDDVVIESDAGANALPRINIGADVWGESSIMTGVY